MTLIEFGWSQPPVSLCLRRENDSTFGLGSEAGHGDDGDDGDEHDGSPVQSPSPAPSVNKKKDKKKAPGDGGGGRDDDPDKDSDDSDEKFVRRMKKFLGGGFNQSNR